MSKPNDEILIVYSDPKTLQLLEVVFSFDNTKVISRLSGKDGLDYLNNSGPVSVVISDYQLRNGVNGLEFLGQVKSLSPDTIRILMTDSYPEEELVAFKKKGYIHEYIQKPIDLMTIQKKVNVFLTVGP